MLTKLKNTKFFYIKVIVWLNYFIRSEIHNFFVNIIKRLNNKKLFKWSSFSGLNFELGLGLKISEIKCQ